MGTERTVQQQVQTDGDNAMAKPYITRSQTPDRWELCAHCLQIQACQPQADLVALTTTRCLLEAEYGWDVFSFMAEAKRHYRKAKVYHCPVLAAVQAQAAALAPEVDFRRVD